MAKNKRPGKPQGMNLAQTKAWEKQVFDALVEQRAQEKFERYQHRLERMCGDAATLASGDAFHMGPTRYEPFRQAMVGYVNEMARMIVDDAQDDPDFVYTKTKVDQRLKRICGDKFQPWEERYEDGT